MIKELSKEEELVVVSFGEGIKFLREEKIYEEAKLIEIKRPYLLKFNEKELDFFDTISSLLKQFDVTSFKLTSSLTKEANKVVVDSSLLGLLLSKIYKKECFFITNNTDLSIFFKNNKKVVDRLVEKLLTGIDKILVCDFPPPYTVSFENLRDFENMEFIGPLVSPPTSSKKLKESYGVLSLGALDKDYSFLEDLSNLSYKVVNKYISKGSLVRKKNIRDYYKNSSWILTHGGHSTIMEAILLGVPLLVSPSPNHVERINNAKGVEKLKVGKYLPRDHLSPLIIERAIEELNFFEDFIKSFSKWANRFNSVKAAKDLILS